MTLAREWMESEPQSAGVFYADGHVRVYHGSLTALPRRHVARQKPARPDDARALLRELFRTAADLAPDLEQETLTVQLHPLNLAWLTADSEAVPERLQNGDPAGRLIALVMGWRADCAVRQPENRTVTTTYHDGDAIHAI